MVKLSLKKNAFEIENIEEFMKIIVAEDQKTQEFYAKILLPTNHVPLQRVLRTKFQADFNRVQRANVDHDLQSMGYEAWNICRDANWRVKWHMLNWFKDSRNGHVKVNMGILLLLIFAFFMFGIIFGGLR